MGMTRDEMIEVAAAAIKEMKYANDWYGSGENVIRALIAAGVVPSPETPEAEVSVPCVAIGNGDATLPDRAALERHVLDVITVSCKHGKPQDGTRLIMALFGFGLGESS